MESLKTRPKRSHPSLQIRQEHCDKFGYTHGCPGCSSRLRGLQRQSHNLACKERFSELLETAAFLENEDAQQVGAKRRSDAEEEVEAKKLRSEGDGGVDDVPMTSGATSSLDVPSRDATMTGKRQSDMSLDELEASIAQILCDIDGNETAWDDVNANAELPIKEVKDARIEEMGHIKEKVFEIVKRKESYEKTGKAPKSTKWVDTDKSHGQGQVLVRSRWVARDFKTRGERDREYLFCATPPLELLRFMVSKQATASKTGKVRKSMFIDVKKAHLIPKCDQDVYVELPPEAGAGEDEWFRRQLGRAGRVEESTCPL